MKFNIHNVTVTFTWLCTIKLRRVELLMKLHLRATTTFILYNTQYNTLKTYTGWSRKKTSQNFAWHYATEQVK